MPNLSLWVLLWSWALPQSADSPLLGAAFENRRLHIRVNGPAGWQLVSDGSSEGEPIEFWKDGESGPRVQIVSFPYALSDASAIDEVQEELARPSQVGEGRDPLNEPTAVVEGYHLSLLNHSKVLRSGRGLEGPVGITAS